MSTRFERFIPFVLAHETEYKKGHYGDDAYVLTEHDPDDPGGTTRYGIDQRSHPGVEVEKLSREHAIAIFEQEWKDGGCEQRAYPLGEVTFDTIVNCGRPRTDRLLSITTEIADFLDERDAFYRRLAGQKPGLKKYLNGWLNRTADLRQYIAKPWLRFSTDLRG